jgi:ribosomal protein S18 acetylase RimI-like enzyme
MIEIRLLGSADAAVLAHVAPDVFDHEPESGWTAEFLADDRHHLTVAIDDGCVVGFASAVHYVHPDKPPELWINEVAVAETHRGRGIGKRLVHAILQRGREVGCTSAWVAADQSNTAAHRLYESAGGGAATEPFVMFEFTLREAHGDSSGGSV